MVTPLLLLSHKELPITAAETYHTVTLSAQGAYIALLSADTSILVTSTAGTYFGPRYFGHRYFGARYFG